MDNFPQEQRNEENKKVTVFGLPKMREKVLTALGDAYTNNDLDMDEYERRLEIAHDAKSIEELQPAVRDFPQYNTLFPAKVNAQRRVSPSPAENMLSSMGEVDFVNIIGNKHLTTHDFSGPNVKVITGIGDTVLDLRDIAKKYSHIKITNYSGIGSLKLKVPANAMVKRNLVVMIGEWVQKVKGEGFFQKLFGKVKKEIYPIQSNEPPIYIDVAGFKLIGEVIVEYEKEPEL